MKKFLKIIQINSTDKHGGSAKISYKLHTSYKKYGHKSILHVGKKYGGDTDVIEINQADYRNKFAKYWFRKIKLYREKKLTPQLALVKRLYNLSEPRRNINKFIGKEDFNFPGTHHILESNRFDPNIIHLHNLHEDYFDLKVLPEWGKKFPVNITLHDTWMLSGHCAYSIDCQNWKTGCGNCPDLSRYPSINFDATRYNWQRKKEIFAQSSFYITAVSQWILDQIEQSMLAPGIVKAKVIHNGVDDKIFTKGNKNLARTELNLPIEHKIVLYVGVGAKNNPYKDYWTVEKAAKKIAELNPEKNVLLVCLGRKSEDYLVGSVQIKFIPYIFSEEEVAKYFQAADLYLHAANADTFPNVILEALACGTPVIATNVGGISEQIQDGETGYLVPRNDYNEMAARAQSLIRDNSRLKQFSNNAELMVKKYFTLDRMVMENLEWYQEIIEDFRKNNLEGN